METKIIRISNAETDLQAITSAALIIKNGGLVAFPTETVYGLGADAQVFIENQGPSVGHSCCVMMTLCKRRKHHQL